VYNNLNAEMARNQIKPQQIADVIGKKYGQTRLKLKGDYSFTMEEAAKIKKELFPDLDLDYLFATK